MMKSATLSLRKLRLPSDTITVFRKSEAPEILQELDLSNEGTQIIIVPDALASILRVHSLYSEKIKGGTVYVA